ncbi:MAG: alpha/beta fold hydrolase [Acidobacteriota bacterium]|nr:alpha/beta fold hydrolase [Acidobacteriota bacterium]
MRIKQIPAAVIVCLLSASAALTAGRPPQVAPAQVATAPAPAALATAPDQQFTAEGVTLRYREAGAGDAVVLIHGYSAALESMLGVAKALPQTHRMVALDARGFGRSSKFAEPARFGQQMVDDVIRLMDHLKIPRAHVIGHSMGALIAANVAARYPDRVTTATLVAGPFYADAATFSKESAQWIADLEGGAGLVNFMQWLFPAMKPEMAGMVSAQAMKGNDLGSLINVLKSLPAMAVNGMPKGGNKVLLVAGTGDPLHPLSVAFAKQSPGARLVEVPGGDHVGVLTNAAAVTAMRAHLQQ